MAFISRRQVRRCLLQVTVCSTCILLLFELLRNAETFYHSTCSGCVTTVKPGNSFDLNLNLNHSSDTKWVQLIKEAESVQKSSYPVMITLINEAYLPFAYNWLCNTARMDIHKHVVFLTTDVNTKQSLKANWSNLRAVAIASKNGSEIYESQEYSHVGYVKLMAERTEAILALLLHKIEILLFEVDALWLSNALTEVMKFRGFDLVGTSVSQRPGEVAGGFLYLKPTEATTNLWFRLTLEMNEVLKKVKGKDTTEHVSESTNDQVFLSKLLRESNGDIRYRLMPSRTFADGKWYDLTEMDKDILRPVLINNNWVIGNQKKMLRAKKHKHWFLNASNSCDMRLVNDLVK